MGDEATIDEVIDDVDTDNVWYCYLGYVQRLCYYDVMVWTNGWAFNLQDGKINYQEFVAMMRKGILDNDEKEKPR